MRGGYSWHEEADGTYTYVLNVEYKDGTIAYEVIEENISGKEYFKRKLDGSAQGRLAAEPRWYLFVCDIFKWPNTK